MTPTRIFRQPAPFFVNRACFCVNFVASEYCGRFFVELIEGTFLMDIKSRLLDAQAIDRALMRMSHEIIEKNQDEKEICRFGILRRGVPLAKQIAENIAKISDVMVNTGALDISFYRDDLTKVDEAPRLNGTSADFTVQDKTVVLVDDVLYTGRTARAAMEAVLALGRPKRIQLAVLVDRGHRELPIRGDFVGKNVPTSQKELVSVRVPEFDGVKEVVIVDNN